MDLIENKINKKIQLMEQTAYTNFTKISNCKMPNYIYDNKFEILIMDKELFNIEKNNIKNSFKVVSFNNKIPIYLIKNVENILITSVLLSRFSIKFYKNKIIIFENEVLNNLSEAKLKNRINTIINEKEKDKTFKLFLKLKTKNIKNRIRGINIKTRYKIFQKDNFTCNYCKSQGMRSGGNAILTIDHIIPIQYGGSNEENNLQTLCIKCNIKKSDNILL